MASPRFLILMAQTLLALWLCLTPRGALSWEIDLHYGLTRWLALKAGLDECGAETVGRAAEEADESSALSAPPVVFWYTCLGEDAIASRLVQETHFPSYGPVPGGPDQRIVYPGGGADGEPPLGTNGATIRTRKEIRGQFSDEPRDWGLSTFGASLHALEDSWSHQGEPEPPLLCDHTLAWGHPAARGHYWQHYADHTYLHVSDTLQTAAAVFDAISQYANSHPGVQVNQPSPLGDLMPDIKSFAEARTRSQKRVWFIAHGFREPTFIDKTSLTEDSSRPEEFLATRLAVTPKACPDARDPRRFVDEFLKAWIVSRDFGLTIGCIDVEMAFSRILRGNKSRLNPSTGVLAILQGWLLKDHGEMSGFGHGDPTDSRFDGSPRVASPAALIHPETLADAISSFVPGDPYVSSRAPGSAGSEMHYIALFQFKHALGDVVVIDVGQRDGRWLVQGIDSIVVW